MQVASKCKLTRQHSFVVDSTKHCVFKGFDFFFFERYFSQNQTDINNLLCSSNVSSFPKVWTTWEKIQQSNFQKFTKLSHHSVSDPEVENVIIASELYSWKYNIMKKTSWSRNPKLEMSSTSYRIKKWQNRPLVCSCTTTNLCGIFSIERLDLVGSMICYVDELGVYELNHLIVQHRNDSIIDYFKSAVSNQIQEELIIR